MGPPREPADRACRMPMVWSSPTSLPWQEYRVRDARKAGELQERLDLISAWREAPVFSGCERATLAWTEAVTWADGVVPHPSGRRARRLATKHPCTSPHA